jgi:hypothetical protein
MSDWSREVPQVEHLPQHIVADTVGLQRLAVALSSVSRSHAKSG